MSSYYVMTLEFQSKASIDGLPDNWSDIIRVCKKHGRYLSLGLEGHSLGSKGWPNWGQEIVEELSSQLQTINRVALCICKDTSDSGSFRLYEVQESGDVDKVDLDFNDLDEAEWDYMEGHRTILKNKYGFDAWTIWQFWDLN